MQAAWENNTEIDCSISSVWYQFSLTDINQAKWKELFTSSQNFTRQYLGWSQ